MEVALVFVVSFCLAFFKNVLITSARMDYFGIVDESPHWPKSRESRVFSFPEDVAEEEKEKKEEFVTLTFPDGKTVKMPLLSGSQG